MLCHFVLDLVWPLFLRMRFCLAVQCGTILTHGERCEDELSLLKPRDFTWEENTACEWSIRLWTSQLKSASVIDFIVINRKVGLGSLRFAFDSECMWSIIPEASGSCRRSSECFQSCSTTSSEIVGCLKDEGECWANLRECVQNTPLF